MLITLLYGIAGAALGIWAAAQSRAAAIGGASVPTWLATTAAVLAMVALGGWLGRRALPVGPARLSWDGASWQLHVDPPLPMPLRRVVVSIDLGVWLLLQLVPADGRTRRWQVASARSAGADWHGLRVALQAHAGEQQAQSDVPAVPS